MDPANPQAQAIAIKGSRIQAVGSDDAISRLACAATEVLHCDGALLIPGFIDAHAHLLGTAARIGWLECSNARSLDGIVGTIRAASPASSGWIRAYGYHDQLLNERRHPTRIDLDRASQVLPIRLVHASGHASVLNSAGLRAVGLDSASEEPAGGSISRDLQSGKPDGLLLEMEDWLDSAMPSATPDEILHSTRSLSGRLLRAGVTSVQDLGHRNDRRRAERLAHLAAAGAFLPRVSMATGFDAFAAGEDAIAPGIGRGPVKIMLNESAGTLVPDAAVLASRVRLVHNASRQVAIHAVGADAISRALDAIETAQRDNQEHRHRIEHASVTSPETAARMRRLGVAAVSNPGFLWQHGDRYLETVGAADLPHLYDVAGLIKAGVLVAAGSDSPIGPLNPLTAVAAAVTRRTSGGNSVDGTTLAFDQAISLFTSHAADVIFEEDIKGRIVPGLLADVVLVDPASDPARVLMTVLNGEIVAH
jgi:predicted amidohydrolase YtcJ